MRGALYVLLGAIIVGVPGAVLEGPVVHPISGHRYYLLDAFVFETHVLRQVTWTESEAEAVALGGHLVTINDGSENTWVYETFSMGKEVGEADRSLWIGFTDEAAEGDWVWVSGQTPRYTNWFDGEPGNWNYSEHYGQMFGGGGGRWNDVDNVSSWFPPTYAVVEVATCTDLVGNFDGDCDVDASDRDHLRACATGPALGPPTTDCRDADLDHDSDVDQTDFGILQRSLTNP